MSIPSFINFQLRYNRENFLDFLEGFLPDDFIHDVQEISADRSFDKIERISKIGQSASLGLTKGFPLTVYEARHKSENDPRVSLTREMFGLMRDQLIDRALIVFYSRASQNYRFSLMKIEVEPKGRRLKTSFSNPRRFSFYLGPDAKIHTPDQFLLKKGKVDSFEELAERFNVEVVTKEFYQELANWYFWALDNVKFPKQAEEQPNGKSMSVIRLITRLIFIWFMKKRGLVPAYLFDETKLEKILQDVSPTESTYYKAILQNLFFATLNTPIKKRRFTTSKNYKGINKDYGINDIYRYEENFKQPEKILELFKDIPFLNGGLFECLDNKEEKIYIDGFSRVKKNQPHVPNFLFFSPEQRVDLNKYYGTKNKKFLVKGLINLLNLYNFTVDENTPAEVEISVDPEMLGRIFENLLAQINPQTGKSARKATGSYYTPREIVDYMVNESLKLYLYNKTKLPKDKIDYLLAYTYDDQNFELSDKNIDLIIDALYQIKICDPACGSGAFPMGIVQKMLLILQKVDPNAQKWSAKQLSKIQDNKKREETKKRFQNESRNYVHKIGIIQNAIYGVDIQPIAVEISKLRFFLSLIVDERIDDSQPNNGIEPLPNLEFKFVCANSLISLPEQRKNTAVVSTTYNNKQALKVWQTRDRKPTKSQISLSTTSDAEQLKNLRDQYLRAYGEEKKLIEQEFRKTQNRLFQSARNWRENNRNSQARQLSTWDPFSNTPSEWFDPEWMFGIKDGFDIVIANPPYVSYGLRGGQEMLSNEKELLKKSFPNSAEYKISLYALFMDRAIQIARSDSGQQIFIVPDSFLLGRYFSKIRKYILQTNVMKSILFLPYKVFDATIGFSVIYCFQRKEELNRNNLISVRLAKNNEQINSGDFIYFDYKQSYFEKTKYNRFRLFFDNKTMDLVSKIEKGSSELSDFMTGRTGVRSLIGQKKIISKEKKSETWQHGLISGSQITKYKVNYESDFINIDPKKLNKGGWDYNVIHNPKLLLRQTGDSITAAIDYYNYYHLNNIHSFAPNNTRLDILYILAIINSRLMDRYYKIISLETNRVMAQTDIETIESLPIKEMPDKAQQPFITLVNKILAITKDDDYLQNQAKQDKVKKYEREIDEMVYKLYGLSEEEIKIVEGKN